MIITIDAELKNEIIVVDLDEEHVMVKDTKVNELKARLNDVGTLKVLAGTAFGSHFARKSRFICEKRRVRILKAIDPMRTHVPTIGSVLPDWTTHHHYLAYIPSFCSAPAISATQSGRVGA